LGTNHPGHAALNRNVKRCTIYASLSAADDLYDASLPNRSLRIALLGASASPDISH
jgi:hypothetical protein